jgi:hypothetical protein
MLSSNTSMFQTVPDTNALSKTIARNSKIVTIGIPTGFSKKLADRVSITNLNRQGANTKQSDVIAVNIYPNDIRFGEIVLKPFTYLFDLSLFLGKKQNSRSALSDVKAKLTAMKNDNFLMHQLQQVCAAVKLANQVPMLEAGLEMWQAILAMSLELETPYQHFKFQPVKGGVCKWLGAWGGDMLLINDVFEESEREALKKYQIISWNDIVVS